MLAWARNWLGADLETPPVSRGRRVALTETDEQAETFGGHVVGAKAEGSGTGQAGQCFYFGGAAPRGA